ncbi:TIP41-like protein [Bacillus rossius redtenbacheri]|uniref:TIP41-like protein n=1 Tax=Bacillus rossius redtenbacheri TaxID=93214 RepID=UPI002FDDA403
MDRVVNDGDCSVKTTVEEKFHDWTIGFTKSHILHSQCTTKEACADPEGKKCLLCLYSSILELPHMPDMVFPSSVLWLKHASGRGIEFRALDALQRVCNGKQGIKIACSDSWKESREEASNMTEFKPFDWTFTTDYSGSVIGGFEPTPTTERIDLDKLKQKERILFYEDLMLFEDELHDNGIAVCSVKIRVMPSSFYILLRFFLRVDDVLVRINDTRIYHEFGTDHVLREYTSREAKIADLKIPSVALTEPNVVASHLPLVNSRYEKLSLPSPPAAVVAADT